MSELKLSDIWDDATNAVCQAMQKSKMCKCKDGECIAAKIEPSAETVRHWNTRAVPDVPELVTVGHLWEYAEYYRDDRGYYGYVKIITEENPSTHVSPASKIRHHRELVTREQAAEIIAAKDKEIEKQKRLTKSAEDFLYEVSRKLGNAEAKLAQYEAQEPVAWMHPEARWTDVSKQEVAVHCKVGTYPLPLYAAPVSDSLKAENERLREALTVASMSAGFQYMTFETRALINAALAGDSNDKG